ncbi:MAG: type II secretion system GspH family protein, partial [Gemmataceae bacterium]|nr:type II secretion system GspH family protein [Gemmataceae bacterium]
MRNRRQAMTLIELLVVLAVLATLGGLLAFVFPTFRERSRAAKGAQALQTWLNYARGRAALEQRPMGLRFNLTGQKYQTASGEQLLAIVRECQYVEQPDDYRGAALFPDPSNPADATLVQVGGPTPTDFSSGDVLVGDVLEVLDSGTV